MAPSPARHKTSCPAIDGLGCRCADIIDCETCGWEFIRDDEYQGFYRDRMCKGCEQHATDLYADEYRLAEGATALRRATQKLHDALQRHLTDFPGRPLPRWLVEGMDQLEAAWHKADGTLPEDSR